MSTSGEWAQLIDMDRECPTCAAPCFYAVYDPQHDRDTVLLKCEAGHEWEGPLHEPE